MPRLTPYFSQSSKFLYGISHSLGKFSLNRNCATSRPLLLPCVLCVLFYRRKGRDGAPRTQRIFEVPKWTGEQRLRCRVIVGDDFFVISRFTLTSVFFTYICSQFTFMARSYSQQRALLAITKASFKSIFKSPSSTFFSLFFPIVLIIIFGSIGGGGGVSFDVAFADNSDTSNIIYNAITHAAIFDVQKGTKTDIQDRLTKGRISAILNIQKTDSGKYELHVTSTTASQRELPQLVNILNGMVNEVSIRNEKIDKIANITVEQLEVRPYRRIDFYLPAMKMKSLGKTEFKIGKISVRS